MTAPAFAPLANRDYRYLLAGFAIGQMLMPLQFITQILWVQQFAPKDIWLILVAAIAASRGLGALTFGLYGGALADRFDRRKLILAVQGLQVVGTVGIAALMHFATGNVFGYAAFFALTFVTAGLQSVDGPTRLAIVPDVLGPDQTPAGMSLNQVAGQVVMPIAMMLTGIIIDGFGYAGAYLFSVLGHLSAILFINLMNYVPAGSQHLSHGKRYGFGEAFTDIRVGLGWARNHPVIFWLIMLLILMMSMGYPATASLGPTWVTTVVNVPIADMGFVVMFWGIGSLIGAVAMAQLASFERRGALIAGGTILFSISFVIFVFDHTKLNAIIGNVGLGAGMTITMVSSTILIQHLTPNEMRGRVMSLFQLNMAFAQLMTMPVAMLGQWLTLPVLFPILSFMTLAVVVAILATQLQLVRARIDSAGA
ncbi:MAG: MFS transporter [Pseudomonadales bacterium]|nr:MFS transporter [Pseudomonadales bacterium]